MREKGQSLEQEIKQLLEDSKAENDALKKLIAALQAEEMKNRPAKKNPDKSSQHKTI